MIRIVRIPQDRGDYVTLVVSEISSMRWDRGHSYANFIIEMKNGAKCVVRNDTPGNVGDAAEKDILKAMGERS